MLSGERIFVKRSPEVSDDDEDSLAPLKTKTFSKFKLLAATNETDFY